MWQVWRTVCLPPCHPGMDSSQPSSQWSPISSWVPRDTSQWVKYTKCLYIFFLTYLASILLPFKSSVVPVPAPVAGPFPVLSLMIGTVVTRLVPEDGTVANITGFEGLTMDEQRVLVASSVTFLAGIMQVRQVHSRQLYSLVIPDIFKRKQLNAVHAG